VKRAALKGLPFHFKEKKMYADGTFSLVDIYSTKGAEYLIAALFFVCLVFFMKSVFREPWKKMRVKWDKPSKN
jgi:hypothetical protein